MFFSHAIVCEHYEQLWVEWLLSIFEDIMFSLHTMFTCAKVWWRRLHHAFHYELLLRDL